jgi:cytochrome d ubiquinol oxidase subunit II
VESLILSWTVIIAFCIAMYVILDGFTLGTGIVLPFVKSEEQKTLVFSSILPTWDGNQTWLVLSAAAIYGTFPVAFSLVLPTLYFPVMIMIIALLFRGIVFEFRLKAEAVGRKRWDTLFSGASLVATLMQGIIIGTFITGFDGVVEGHLIPAYDWLSAFSLFTGVCLVFGYALLGSTRLILKTTGALQTTMFHVAKYAVFTSALLMLIFCLWAPFIDPHIKHNWFIADPWYILILPIGFILSFLCCVRSLYKGRDYRPYWASVFMFAFAYLGAAYCVWPYIVPHSITIFEGAASRASLKFTIVGALVMVPVLLLYTGYSYRIFRGKVREDIHY